MEETEALINKDCVLQNKTGNGKGGNVNFFDLRAIQEQNERILSKLNVLEQGMIELAVRFSELERKRPRK